MADQNTPGPDTAARVGVYLLAVVLAIVVPEMLGLGLLSSFVMAVICGYVLGGIAEKILTKTR